MKAYKTSKTANALFRLILNNKNKIIKILKWERKNRIKLKNPKKLIVPGKFSRKNLFQFWLFTYSPRKFQEIFK